MSDLIYEHMWHYERDYKIEDYILPDSIKEELYRFIDSLTPVYRGMSFDQILDYLVNEGKISSELRLFFNDLFTGLDNTDDPLEFLSTQQFNTQIDSLPYVEKLFVQSFIASLHGYLRYIDDQIRMNSSNYNGKDVIELRGEEGCKYTVLDAWKVFRESLSENWKAGMIFVSLIGLASLSGNVPVAVGLGAVLVALAMPEVIDGGKFYIYCTKCELQKSHYKATGDCDGSAFFWWDGGPYTKFVNSKDEECKNIRGIPFTISIDDRIRLTQIENGVRNAVVVVYPLCQSEGDPFPIKFDTVIFRTVANLFKYQKLIPAGALSYHGEMIVEYPYVGGGPYDEEYAEVGTYVYDLAGLAFEESWLDVMLLPTGRRNVKEVYFDKVNRKLTVTWRIARPYWDEFVSYCITTGRVELEVYNICPEGERKIYPLEVEIYSRDCYDDDP